MKVKDLIEKLSEYNPELEVCIPAGFEGYDPLEEEDLSLHQQDTAVEDPPYGLGKYYGSEACAGDSWEGYRSPIDAPEYLAIGYTNLWYMMDIAEAVGFCNFKDFRNKIIFGKDK